MRQSNAYKIIFVSMIMLAITIMVSFYRDAENRRAEGEKFLFPDLSEATDKDSLKLLNDIAEIQVINNNSKFSIKRNKDNWFLPSLANFPVPLDKIKRVIVGIAQLEAIEPKTKNPELHGQLGLNNEQSKINSASSITLINEKSQKIASILVGNDSKFGKETRYVRKPDNDQTWLVWRNFDIPKNGIDWLDDTLFSIHRGRVADITIIHPDGHEVLIQRGSYAEQYFKIQNLDDDTLPINPYVGNQLGSALDNISLVNIALKNDIMFSSDAVTIVYTTFDGIKLTIKNQNINGLNWVSFVANADINLRRELPKDGPINVGLAEMDSFKKVEEEAIKLNNKFSNWVFTLNNEKHTILKSRIEDLTKKKDLEKKE